MQYNKHNIRVVVPRRKPYFKTFAPHPDFRKYKEFATLVGFEDGCTVTVMCPVNHPDFKQLKAKGYKEIERWIRSEVKRNHH